MSDLYRVCVKLYSPEPRGGEGDAALFVPIFHEWIRDQVLDLVPVDVADYAHAPDSPGIMLVCHEVSFALDRSDGRFGLLAQRRTPLDGTPVEAVARTLRQALRVAALLHADPRLATRLAFDAASPRIEANDRLRAPNTDAGYESFMPVVGQALAQVYGDRPVSIVRVLNDPRDRLALDVRVEAEIDAQEYLAA